MACLFQIWAQWMNSTQDSWFNRCSEGGTGKFMAVVWTRNHRFHCCKTSETEKSTFARNCFFMLYLASSVVPGFSKERQHTHTEVVLNDSCLQLCFFLRLNWNSLTVACRLPSVLYANTIMSLFEEALSICWIGQIHAVCLKLCSLSIRWVQVKFSFLAPGYWLFCWSVFILVGKIYWIRLKQFPSQCVN